MKDYERITHYIDSEMTCLIIPQRKERIELYAERLAELENKIEMGTLIEIPCVREINSPLAKYEAVYINNSGIIQECLVNSIKQGWLIIKCSGNAYCHDLADEQLKELDSDE